jgi:DNA polymerase-3 subunit epsilon
MAIHGITNEMVAKEPVFDAVANELVGMLTDTVLVFHNAAFDMPFLMHEFSFADLHFKPPVFLDTLKYARKHGNFRSNSLGNISCELGFCNKGWHRALADAEMTEKIFFHFLNKFKSLGVQTLGELIELQKGKIKIDKKVG